MQDRSRFAPNSNIIGSITKNAGKSCKCLICAHRQRSENTGRDDSVRTNVRQPSVQSSSKRAHTHMYEL